MKDRFISIKIKLGLAVLVVILVGVGSYILIIAPIVRNSLVASVTEESRRDTVLIGKSLQDRLTTIGDDVTALSETPPVQGLIRAVDDGGVDQSDNSTDEQWKNRMEQLFVSAGLSKGFYYQLRYIDEEGQEIVRVDFKNGEALEIRADELQNKGDRYYFTESVNLPAGSLYVSSVDLNREGSPPKIEEPYVPVVRYAVPVHDEHGSSRGIVIANVYANVFLKTLPVAEAQEFYIVDEEGYYLSHPDAAKEWGGTRDLDTGENIKNDLFGGVVADIMTEENGVVEVSDSIVSFQEVSLSDEGGKEIVFVKEVKKTEIFKVIDKITKTATLIAIIIGSLIVIAIIYITSRTLKPLSDLSKATERVGSGDFTKLVSISHNDEIGVVARSFNGMMAKLANYYKDLEGEVEEKTRQLNKKALDLQKYYLAVENASDHIVITDPDGIVLYANAAVEKITGFSKKEVLGNKAGSKELWGGLMEKSFYEKMWKTIKTDKKSFSGEIKNKRKSGVEYYSLASISPILNSKNEVQFFVGIERDITKEKEVDQAKTEFVSLASHQLRTPLSAINWYIEMVMAEDVGKINTEQRQYLEEAYAGSKRMVDLVNALLNVSRIEMGTFVVDPQPTNVLDLVRSVLDELKIKIDEKDLKIKEGHNENTEITADPKLLRIVVQNLLTNAVKYTPAGGEISVNLDRLNKGSEIRAKKLVEDCLLLKVADSGYGIPKSQQGKIFSKLFRADNVKERDTEGTGLGLYIVKSIIEHSAGEVWFESEEGKGTTFYICIPVSGMKKKEGEKELSA